MHIEKFKALFDDPMQTHVLGYYLASKLTTTERNTLMANTAYPHLQGLDPQPDTDDKKNYQIASHYAETDLLNQTKWDNTLTDFLAEGDRTVMDIMRKAANLT